MWQDIGWWKMGKNKVLINQYRRLQENIRDVTPSVYAALALALHRKHGWGFKRINDLFVESQIIWNECISSDIKMLEMCEKETGIDVKMKVEEKACVKY